MWLRTRRYRIGGVGLAGVLGVAGCSQRPESGLPVSVPPVVIDGDFSEWTEARVAVPAASAGGTGSIDVREVRAGADGEAAFLLLDLGRTVNLQVLEVPARLVLDVDGDGSTGALTDGVPGADLVVMFSPAAAGGRPGQGILLERPSGGSAGTAYDIGLIFGPTYASARFEMRIDRAAAAAFAGVPIADRWRARWIADGRDGSLHATETFELVMPASSSVERGYVGDPLARSEGADVRVVAWNVADDGVLTRPGAFARVLRALDPDVLLLDELPGAIDDAGLDAFLRLLDGPWRSVLGSGGGRQRSAVASRLPLEPAPSLARIDYPDSVGVLAPLAQMAQTRRDLATASDDGISAAGAFVSFGGRRLLFVALDLACCGSAFDAEDRLRRIQASAIRDAAGRAVDGGGVDGVVVGGDFNLVGSRTPLEIVAAGLDPVGNALVPVFALQLDGQTATTWRAPGLFPAGRLDWILYSSSTLEPVRAFAFEVADLDPVWRDRYDLRVELERTSDHLPVVVDLRTGHAPPQAR